MDSYASSILVSAGINMLLALGLYLVIRSGQFSVVNVSLGVLAGYVSAWLGASGSVPALFAMLSGVLLAGLGGVGISLLLRKMDGLTFGLATLALGETLGIVARLGFPGGGQGMFGVRLLDQPQVAVGIALAICVIGIAYYERTFLGLHALAAGRDSVAASSVGIDVIRARALAFGFGGIVSGMGGVLGTHYVGLAQPGDFGFAAELPVLIAVLLGGSRSAVGPVAGAAAVMAMQEVFRFSAADRFWILGLFLVLIVLLRPNGMLPATRIGARWPRSGDSATQTGPAQGEA